MNTAYLGLGSNLGDRIGYLNRAVDLLSEHPFIEVEAVSDFINTTAVSSFSQPDFMNGAIHILTLLTPEELFSETRNIERRLDRHSKGDHAPRTIDIDILLYNDLIMSTDTLTIPHPLMHERAFVLIPLSQLAPDVVHPILNIPIKALASML